MTLPVVRSSKELAVALSQDLPKYFVRGEMEIILAEAREKPKNFLFLTLLWQTGARVSELLMTRVRDINLTTRTIGIHTLKRKRKPKRVLPVKPETVGVIAAYIVTEKLESSDFLFKFSRQWAFKIVKKAVLQAGFEEDRAHPHAFRHSFAINCLLQEEPVPITVLKEWLGHANITNTLIYTKILARDARQYFDKIRF